MTDYMEKLTAIRKRQDDAEHDLVRLNRTLIPVLKDHNIGNLAKSIEEIIFTIDATEAELFELFRAYPDDRSKKLSSRSMQPRTSSSSCSGRTLMISSTCCAKDWRDEGA